MALTRERLSNGSLRQWVFLGMILTGLVPLGLNLVLLAGSFPSALDPLRIGLVATGGLALLVALSWLLSTLVTGLVSRPLRALRTVVVQTVDGEAGGWASTEDGVRDVRILAAGLNEMAARLQGRVDELQRAERRSAELARSSQDLIRAAVSAKLPLAKSHPGLLTAYCRAAARFLGRNGDAARNGVLADALVESPGPEREVATPSRSRPRFEISRLSVDAPVRATALNISERGMALEGLQPVTTGASDRFTLSRDAQRIRVRGNVRWCRIVRILHASDGDSMPVYRAGIEFLDDSPSIRELCFRAAPPFSFESADPPPAGP